MEIEASSPSEDKQTDETLQSQQVINEKEVSVSKYKSKCPQYSIVIEPLTFVIFLSDSLSEPVITNFILTKTCENHFKFNKSVCDQLGNSGKNESDVEALVQPYASVILTGMSLLSLFLPAVMSLFLGSWSDSNGRKLLLVVPAFGYVLKYLLLIMLSFIPNMNPALGLVSVIPVALSGGFISVITALYSYISDITTEEKRSFRLSILESAMVCGGITGLLLTSPIYNAGGQYGHTLIFGVAAAGFLLSMVLSLFFLPESVEVTETGKGFFYIFELTLVKEMVKVCFKKREGFQRAAIFLVILSGTATICQMQGESNILFLFTRLKFNWSIQEYTRWCVVSLVCGFFGLLLGTLILVKYMKISDSLLGMIAYVTKAASCLYLAFLSSNASNMYYSGLICSLSGLSAPAGRSILSKIVPSNDLGKIFALTGSLETLFPLAVAPVYTWIYDSTLNTFPSAVFLLSGCILITNTIVYIFLYFILKTTNEPVSVEDNGDCTRLIQD